MSTSPLLRKKTTTTPSCTPAAHSPSTPRARLTSSTSSPSSPPWSTPPHSPPTPTSPPPPPPPPPRPMVSSSAAPTSSSPPVAPASAPPSPSFVGALSETQAENHAKRPESPTTTTSLPPPLSLRSQPGKRNIKQKQSKEIKRKNTKLKKATYSPMAPANTSGRMAACTEVNGGMARPWARASSAGPLARPTKANSSPVSWTVSWAAELMDLKRLHHPAAAAEAMKERTIAHEKEETEGHFAWE